MSTEPLRLHDLPAEARRLREETRRLLAEIDCRGRTSALTLRANDLRRRTRKLGRLTEELLAFDAAVTIAFRERTGLELGEGEQYSQADAARAGEIARSMRTKMAGKC